MKYIHIRTGVVIDVPSEIKGDWKQVEEKEVENKKKSTKKK